MTIPLSCELIVMAMPSSLIRLKRIYKPLKHKPDIETFRSG